jgi:hypothetical protein
MPPPVRPTQDKQERIPCPFCGEPNIKGSNICGQCLRHISHVANPERADMEETMFEHTPAPRTSFWRRLWRKLWR